MKRYIPPEVLAEVKKIDFFSYLKVFEPNELVHVAGNEYCLKSDKSVKISNGLWIDFSKGYGGRSALSYFEKAKGYDYIDAAFYILEKTKIIPINYEELEQNSIRKLEEKVLILPQKSPTNFRVMAYLMSRCIDKEIINYCIENNFLYEDLPYHNVVFVGYDDKNIARFACVRATNETRYMHDCKGSSKQYSFKLLSENDKESLHIFESAIDLLSYATLLKKHGMDYKNFNLMSLSGVYQPAKIMEQSKVPVVIENYIKMNPKLKKIILHLDDDLAGKNATKALKYVLENRFIVENKPPPEGKDFNEYLCKLEEKKRKKRELER